MPPIVETIEAPTVAPAFPKWYTEAPVEDSERGRHMDEVRTALLEYPNPEHIIRISYGCIGVHLVSHNVFESVVKHLGKKGFLFLCGDTEDEYIATFLDAPNQVSYSTAFVGKRG